MRVYLPSTTSELTRLRDGETLAGPRSATAVTPALREWYVDTDLEELEYAAVLEAARLSLRMIDADPWAARRRVVIAVDVSDTAVEPDPGSGRAAVQITADVGMAGVLSLLVDGADAEPAVVAATAVVIEADLGSDDAQFVVDGAEAYELSWYASQELGSLLELL